MQVGEAVPECQSAVHVYDMLGAPADQFADRWGSYVVLLPGPTSNCLYSSLDQK